jgi:hypothetical protein
MIKCKKDEVLVPEAGGIVEIIPLYQCAHKGKRHYTSFKMHRAAPDSLSPRSQTLVPCKFFLNSVFLHFVDGFCFFCLS